MKRPAMLGRAVADAAPILERGKAQVEVLRMLAAEVAQGGDQAYSVFMAEKLPQLLSISVDAVKRVDIDRVIVMDGGDGTGVENAVNQRVRGAYGTMEALASTLGIDLEEVLQGASKRLGTGEGEK